VWDSYKNNSNNNNNQHLTFRMRIFFLAAALLVVVAIPSIPSTAHAFSVEPPTTDGSALDGTGTSSSRRSFFNRALTTSAAAGVVAAASSGVPLLLSGGTSVTSIISPPAAYAAPPARAEDDTNISLPQTGRKAPDFELPNSRGEGMTTLSDLTKSGKYTVLYFYPGAFTKGCTLEARNFQRDIETYRQLGAQIVGVSVDPPEKNASFCSSEGLDFYMLSDEGGQLSRTYGSALRVPGFGTFSNRQTYIIDPDGYLRWVFTDVESRVPRHSAEVIEKLEEITGKTATA